MPMPTATSILSRLLLHHKVTIALIRARIALRRDDFVDSMREIDVVYKALGENKPSRFAPVEANILCALIANKLAVESLAIKSCDVALEQLADPSAKILDKYSNEDKSYLRFYCRFLRRFVDSQSAPVFALEEVDPLEYNLLDMNKVKWRLRHEYSFERKK